MLGRSHINIDKLNSVPQDTQFEYRDIVDDSFPIESHSEDGALFNKEVEAGIYTKVVIANENRDKVKYRKLR